MQRDPEPSDQFQQDLRRWFVDEISGTGDTCVCGSVPCDSVDFAVAEPVGSPWRVRALGTAAALVLLAGGLLWMDRVDEAPPIDRAAATRESASVALPEPQDEMPFVEPTVDAENALDNAGVSAEDRAAVLGAFERFIDPDVAASELELGDLASARSALGTLRRPYDEPDVVSVTVFGDRGEVTFAVDAGEVGVFSELVFAFEREPGSDEWAITAESLCAVATRFRIECTVDR